MAPVSRRSLLAGGLVTVSAATVPALTGPARAAPTAPRRRSLANPFTLGVASGDPDPNGLVRWTRLAA